jgi:hypothetical protein
MGTVQIKPLRPTHFGKPFPTVPARQQLRNIHWRFPTALPDGLEQGQGHPHIIGRDIGRETSA